MRADRIKRGETAMLQPSPRRPAGPRAPAASPPSFSVSGPSRPPMVARPPGSVATGPTRVPMAAAPASAQTKTSGQSSNTRTPLYTLKDEGDTFSLMVEIPGADPHEISVELNASELMINASLSKSAKASFSAYRGTLQMPQQVVPDETAGYYVEGLLEIVLPKIKSLKMHKISVSHGRSRSPPG